MRPMQAEPAGDGTYPNRPTSYRVFRNWIQTIEPIRRRRKKRKKKKSIKRKKKARGGGKEEDDEEDKEEEER